MFQVCSISLTDRGWKNSFGKLTQPRKLKTEWPNQIPLLNAGQTSSSVVLLSAAAHNHHMAVFMYGLSIQPRICGQYPRNSYHNTNQFDQTNKTKSLSKRNAHLDQKTGRSLQHWMTYRSSPHLRFAKKTQKHGNSNDAGGGR